MGVARAAISSGNKRRANSKAGLQDMARMPMVLFPGAMPNTAVD